MGSSSGNDTAEAARLRRDAESVIANSRSADQAAAIVNRLHSLRPLIEDATANAAAVRQAAASRRLTFSVVDELKNSLDTLEAGRAANDAMLRETVDGMRERIAA